MSDLEPIAIIGIGCRLPGDVGNAEDFWRLLSEGGSGWSVVPKDRWNVDSFYHPDGTSIQSYNTKSGYFMSQDVADFDSRFFGFAHNEADVTDPQQRILLETTFEALENAGIPMESVKGSDTAVYAALFARDYDRIGYKNLEGLSQFHIPGTGEAIIANRVSHFFDLRGMSMTIDTGCSGSLVALHEACTALRTRQSRMAIVGGTEVLLHPDQNVIMSSGGMLNPDGKCYTFDSRGAGYGRGEGVAVIIVKRLKDALADGDTVHAIVRNSGANQDGKTNGVTLPNPDAQEALIRRVYGDVCLDPAETLYVEAHGTGTKAGDIAEVQSLGNVFTEKTRTRNLYVGSVKTNIGHTEATSGLAGLIKSILVLKHQKIPPNLNFIEPKPGLNLDERQISVPLGLVPLFPEGSKGAQRVSINSFGYGGTNCHVILESLDQYLSDHSGYLTNGPINGYVNEATNGVVNGTNGHSATKHSERSDTHLTNGIEGVNGIHGSNGVGEEKTASAEGMPLIFPLSATSEAALDGMPAQIQKWLSSLDTSASGLRDLSYTLTCRRSLFKWRKAFVASNVAELTAALGEGKISKTRSAPSAKVAFIFTGQGAQWAEMGVELIGSSQTFKSSIESSSQLLKSLGCEWNLVQELRKSAAEESRINESELAQPLTTIIQMALVDLLAHYDVKPTFVAGHSSGEIAAAYAAGALAQEAAVKASYFRGLQSAIAKKLNELPGSMLATGYGEEAALQTIKAANVDREMGRVVVACVNSPSSTTLSGDEPAVHYVSEMLRSGGVFTRKLKVETAYHSHHMEKVASSYLKSLEGLYSTEIKSNVEFHSSVTGQMKTSDFGPAYWVENLVSQVRFNDAMTALLKSMAATGPPDAANILIEIGPHSALQGPINQILSSIPGFKSAYMASLSRGKNSVSSFSAATARLFELGAKVNFEKLFTMPRRVIDNLMPYPWDHRVKHWAESRLSRDHRLRSFPYHDLLGVYDVMSPIEEPRWRHHLSIQRLPWLKDHVVDGMVIFPGSGYSAMVTEAMKQLVQLKKPNSDAKIANTIIRDVRIARPIILPVESTDGPGDDIEVQLILSPSKISDANPWYSIRILSLQLDGTWTEHVTGTVRAELESTVVTGKERKATVDEAFEALERIQSRAQEKMNMETFYDERRAAGNDWGPNFALLYEAHIGPWVGFSRLRVPDIAQCMPAGYFQPHLIHPTTLDASNHMVPAVFHREIKNAPLMPITTEEVLFTNNLSSNPGDEMIVAMELKAEGKSQARGNVWVFQNDSVTDEVTFVSSMRGLVMRAVGEGASTEASKPFQRKHNYQVYWNDDPDHLDKASFARLVEPYVPKTSELLEQLSTIQKATAIYLNRVKDMPVIQNPETAPLPHLCDFSRWISDYVNSDACRKICEALSDSEQAEVLERSDNSGIEGEMLGRVGRNLARILSNTADPLELLVADDLFERFHNQGPLTPLYQQLVEYARLLTNKNAQMNVLEVGAGTGSATLPLFQSMGEDASDLVKKYTYTDISSGFFETAKERLDRWKSIIEYRSLDVSRNPVDQGYEANAYDLIVASNVFHATKSIRETLTNVRKLLKPGGRLLFVEINNSTEGASRSLGTIFGTLPGWWDFIDAREGSPLLEPDQWHEQLLQTSFGGIEYSSQDCDGPLARASFIVSKAIEQQKPSDTPSLIDSVTVVHNPASPVGQSTSTMLTSAFQQKGFSSSINYSWEALAEVDAEACEGIMYVVLDSANSSVLEHPTQEMFDRYQNLIVNCRNLIWISFQEEGGLKEGSIKGLAGGLARVVRRENGGVKLITIDVRNVLGTEDDVSRFVQKVQDVALRLLAPDVSNRATVDEEFALDGDKLLIPRAYADKKFNNWTDLVNGRSNLSLQPFKSPALPLRMDVGTPGLLSSIHFVHDTDVSSPLGSEQIQIDSKAFGVNFRDVLCALGQLQNGTFMGECAGVVTAVGSGEFVQRTYKVGDRVVGMHAQPFASYSRLNGYDAHILPDNMSFADGASMQVVFTTVYYSFVNVARLEAGQSVLVHYGSGGVGQAAIQLAKHFGAEVFVTVGSAEKKQFILDHFDVPESHVLSSRASPRDLKRHLLRLTQNKGVNVVLNSASGEMLAESWDCVASFGFHIELGKTDIDKSTHINMGPFKRNVTFSSVDLVTIAKERPKVFYDVLDKTIALFAKGVLKPVYPLNKYPIDQLESAFRLISERKHIGKVILDCELEEDVQTVLPAPAPTKLQSEGTYIIAGGLGAIGRMLVTHLASRHAGHIITLSRGDLADEERLPWQAEIANLGAKLHVLKCDITDESSVHKVSEYCRLSLPPVRGIFHAGMVLRDRPLAKMNRDEWNAVLGPKVRGTFNLDQAFSSPDLEFFVTLSSIATTFGNPGQGNYSAANAFQDYFATHHDRTHPTRYVSVDLPVVDETQALAQIELGTRSFILQVSMLFDVGELMQLMDYAMNRSVELDRPFLHALMGFDRKSMSQGTGDDLFSALFQTIPQMQTSNSQDPNSAGARQDIESLLTAVNSFEEAVEVIMETTIEKFVRFLNLEADDVGPEQPLSSYGLDSLVSIELKNWMVRAFKVTLQVSELTSSRNIAHLAELLATRSKILPAGLRKQTQDQKPPKDKVEGKASFHEEQALLAQPDDAEIESLPCCPLPSKEARQPVPNLVLGLQKHLENISHFAHSEEEIESLRSAMKEFLAPGSVGEQVYKEIQKDAHDPKISNWISKFLSEGYYMPMRQALQYCSFMVMNHPGPFPHTQADRAALLAVTAFQFKQKIENGTMEPLYILETPVCQAQMQWMFNTYRHPQIGTDEIRKTAGDYCVVFRRGRLFQVPLQNGDTPVSFDSLRATMTAILDHVQDEGTWAGILTSDTRDSWAKIRTELLAVSATNAHYFQVIEEAAFAINLDDSSPANFTEIAKQCKMGSGFNRWHDKPMQFIVTANGQSGLLVEHSYLDGTTPAALYDRVRDAIAAYKPTGQAPPQVPSPEEIPLVLPSGLDRHISFLREQWLSNHALRDFISYELPTLSGPILGQGKVPIKSGYDVLCQLAFFLYNGQRVVPNWQPVMLSHFHDGRHDMVQMASPKVRAFCEAVVATGEHEVPILQKRNLMIEAARDLSRRLSEAKDGKGFFRLFVTIEQRWPKDQPKARVFDDALQKRTMEFPVSNINHNSVESVTTPLDPHALRIRYTIHDDHTLMSLNCPTGAANKLIEAVNEAAIVIRELSLAR